MGRSAILSIKILTDATDAQKGMGSAEKSVGKFTGGLQKAAAPAALALAGIGAAAISAGKAAAEDAQSQAILANALTNNTGATKTQIAAVEDHISAMSAASGVADDELRPAMGDLVRATGDATKAQDLLAAALDISAATGKDVGSVSKALAKASKGSTGALKKLVPGLDDATLASGDMTAIMADLAKQTGGASAAAAETAAGKMNRMQVAMDEAQESIGTALLPAMSKFADVLSTVATLVQEHSTAFAIVAGVVAVFAAAVVIANAAMSIYTAVTTLAASATFAWLWPILLVIAAIALIVVGIILLWKKCDWFRNAVIAVWNAIKAAFSAVVGWLKAAWSNTMNALAAAVKWIRGVFVAVWNAIRGAVAAVANAVRSVWSTVFGWIRSAIALVRAGFVAQFNAIKSVVSTVAGAVRRVWESVFGALKRAASSLGSALSGPFNIVKDAVNNVIDAVQSLIGWFGRIKVPKISLPKIPGFNSTASVVTTSAPVAAGARTAGPTAGTRSTPTGGVVININGAIDPEATARQVRRILTAHDRRMGMATGLRAGTV